MSTYRIQIDGGRTAFEPGQKISGRFEWSFDLPRDEAWVELRLLWHTEGKGTRDGSVVHTQRIDGVQRGERAFEITAPAGPCSLAGTLISVLWGLELVADTDQGERIDLVIAPGGKAVELRALPKEKRDKFRVRFGT